MQVRGHSEGPKREVDRRQAERPVERLPRHHLAQIARGSLRIESPCRTRAQNAVTLRKPVIARIVETISASEEDPGGGPRVVEDPEPIDSRKIRQDAGAREDPGGQRPSQQEQSRGPSRRSSRPAGWRRASDTRTLRLGAARCRAAAGLPRARAAARSPRCPPRTRRRCRASEPWTRGMQRRRCSATRDSAQRSGRDGRGSPA